MRELSRRLTNLERRQPQTSRLVAIFVEGQPHPTDADFVIVIEAATWPEAR